MGRLPTHWNALLIVLALSIMVGCQGFSSGNSSSQNSPPDPPAALSATPASISFGNVQVGTTQNQTDTLTNTGGSNLTLTQATIAGTGFTFTGLNLPLTLAAGQSTMVSVVFNPQAAGGASGTLSVTDNVDSGPLNIALSGMGVSEGSLTPSPASVTFGNVQVGTSQTQIETLTNTGGENLTISQATVTGSAFSITGLSLPLTLTPGQSTTVSVVFSPQVAGSASRTLTVTDDGAGSPLNIAVSGTAVAPGDLSASPTSLSFGKVQVGTGQNQTETLTNTGGENLTVTQAVSNAANFSVTGLSLPLTLTPNQTTTFGVLFSPTAAGPSNGVVSISDSESTTTVDIAVSGTGVTVATLAATPASVTFTGGQIGNVQTQNVTVQNTGGSNATISQDSVTGTGFSISGLDTPLTLTPGQTATLTVTFAPQSSGSFTGSVAISSNASNPNLTIPLSGSATGSTQGQLSISPTTIKFGNVTDGTSGTQTGTLTATGASVVVSSVNSGNSLFVVSGLSFPVTLNPGQSVNFTATFTPQATGLVSSSISFTSNASNSPTSVTVNGTGVAAPAHTVLLTWIASTSQDVIGYNIYRRTGTTGNYTQINTGLNPTTTYTDTSVADGLTYYYETTAVNSSNQESTPSTPVDVSIPSS